MLGHRYEVGAELGQGGMGVVYTAFDRLTRRMVALKQVTLPGEQQLSTTGDNHDYRLALAREFHTLSSLRHPNIISVLDYGFDVRRQPFFTMELLGEAEDIVTAGHGQPLEIQLDYLIQMMQALSYLHRRGIIHRDLKPGNVMVTDGQVKVLDFGLSIAREHRENKDNAQASGTLAYMAPEILEGYPASEASDLYAVGIIAHELLTGKYPFEASNYSDLIDLILDQPPAVHKLQIDDRLQDMLAHLLAKNPNDRYANASKVIAICTTIIGQQDQYETEAIRESFLQAAAFVGRDVELQQLTDGLTQAMAGNGSTWLIGGESGVGKSRLMDELRTNALVRGAIVLRGQGVEGARLPYQLWRNVARRLTLSTELSNLEAGVLKEIVPDIDELLGRDISDAPPLEGKDRQQRLIATLVNILRRQKQPIVMLLEDLQWASEGLELVRQLNQDVHHLSLLIVGNYRNDERPDLPDALPGIETIFLQRLSQTEIAQLSTSIIGITGTNPDLINLLQKETEGNVFFLVEVMRTLAEEAGQLSDIGKTSLPQRVVAGGIQKVIHRRLQRVPNWGQVMLKLAAVAGRQLDLAVLNAIATDTIFEYSLEQWLQACAEAVIIEIQDGHWRFNHDKLREAIINSLSVNERPVLHRRVAEAVERTYPNDPAQAAILLEHWHQAQDTTKETVYAKLVIEQYLTTSNYLGVIAISQRILEIETDPTARAYLLGKLGEAYYRIGEYANSTRYLEQSLELAQQINSKPNMVSSLQHLGYLGYIQGNYDAAQEYFQKSLEVARQINNQLYIAKSLNYIGMIFGIRGDYPAAQVHCQHSLELARRSGDKAQITSALNNLGNIARLQDNYAQADNYYQQCLTHATELGNRSVICKSLINLGMVNTQQKNYQAALAYYTQCYDLAHQIHYAWYLAATLINLSTVRFELHDIDTAWDNLQQGLSIAHADGITPLVLHGLVGIVQGKIIQNDLHTAAKLAGLVMAHPAKDDHIHSLLTPYIDQLKTALPEQICYNDLEHGKTLDLDQVVAQLLEELAE